MRLLRHILLTVDDHVDGALDADGAVFDVADDQAAGVDDIKISIVSTIKSTSA